MASVTLRNVTAGGIDRGMDLAIRDREFVVLTGPAGSGTSMAVRLIAGLEEMSQGEILFDDRRINDIAPKDRDVALLSHDYTPYPRLSVFENLAVGLRRRSFADAEIKKRITAIGAALGLESQLHASVRGLSREQRQRVGLARAMVRQPKVYLFDEPFAGLESTAATGGRSEIAKLHQRSSTTVVYATGAAREALALSQRTVVIVDGSIQQDGLAETIYDAPANLAVAKFLGDPPMNLVTGTVKQGHGALVFSETGDGTISIRLSPAQNPRAEEFLGKTVVLGFHAGDVEIDGSPDAGKRGEGGFRALVERAEPRGLETDFYLNTGAHLLVARSRRWDPRVEGGHRLQFKITEGKTRLFDPETGLRIAPEA